MANEKTRKRVAKATYDFSVDGGAVSTITPAITEIIPTGAIVTDVIIDMTTALTSGGSATVAVTAGGVTIQGAVDYNQLPYSGTGLGHVLRAGASGATGVTTALYLPIKTTSDAAIKVAIATAALTAGKFNVFVEYTL